MRRSRVYLGLSIISLAVAALLGHVADGANCPFGSSDCYMDCEQAPQDDTAHAQLYEYAISGRHDEAIQIAQRLAARDVNDAWATLYHAYALRGAQRMDEATERYSQALLLAEQQEDAQAAIDALTGRAACRTAGDDVAGADRDLTRALEIATRAESTRHTKISAYQLACIHAQRAAVYSRIRSSGTADIEKQRAVRWLKLARARGYDNVRHMRHDQDLGPLAGYSPYESLFD
ncbi:MAG: hypothetical protein IT464_11195 [Planctomycetes bacterium]|nr:hypothetical protein [Planctomycetota bacterium]